MVIQVIKHWQISVMLRKLFLSCVVLHLSALIPDSAPWLTIPSSQQAHKLTIKSSSEQLLDRQSIKVGRGGEVIRWMPEFSM
jgi:hypothetical protein